MKVNILIAILFMVFNITEIKSQSTNSELDSLLAILNTETSPEAGCSSHEYRFENCTIMYSIVCGDNEFELSFKTKNIERVYKAKADEEDQFETLFFECKGGKNCITSNSKMIPSSPVFPIKLEGDKASALGDESLKVFSSVLTNCQ